MTNKLSEYMSKMPRGTDKDLTKKADINGSTFYYLKTGVRNPNLREAIMLNWALDDEISILDFLSDERDIRAYHLIEAYFKKHQNKGGKK